MSNCPDPDVVALMVDNCLIGWTPRREVEVVITGFKTKNTTISCEMSIEGHELRVKTRDGRKRRRKSDVSPEWEVAVPAPYLPVLVNKPPKRRSVSALKRGIVNDPKKEAEAEERKKTLNRSTMNQEAITAALLGLSQLNGAPTPGSPQPSFSPPPLVDQLTAQEAGLPLDLPSSTFTSKTAIPSQGRPENDEHYHQVYHQEYQNFQPYQFPLRHKPLRSKTRSKKQKLNNGLSETFGIPEMLTMEGERTYPCEDCEYSAGRRDHLKRHMLTIHNKVLMSRRKMMERAHPDVIYFNSSTNAPPYRYLAPDISTMSNPLNYDQQHSRVSFATKRGANSNSQFVDLTKSKSDDDSFRSFKDDRQQVVNNQQIAEINSQIIMPATNETFLGGNTFVPSKSNDIDKSLSSLDGWTRLGYLNSSGHIENYFIKELKDDDGDSNDSDPTNVTTQRQKKYAMFRKVLHAKQFQSKPESAKDYQISIPHDQVSQMLVDYVKYPQQYRGGKVSFPAKKNAVGDSRNAASNSGDATHTADDTAHKGQQVLPPHQLLRQLEYENARELAERAALQSQQQRQQQQQQQLKQQQALARARAQQEAAAATAAQKLQVQTYAEQQQQLQQQIDLQNAEHIQQLNQLRQLQQMQGYGAASTPEYPFQQLQYLQPQQQQQAYPPPQFNLPIQGFSGLPSVLPQQFFPPFNVNVGYQQSTGLNDSVFPLGYPQAIQPMYPNVLPIDTSASSYYLPNNHNNLN